MTWLSRVGFEKGKEQEVSIHQLNSTVQEQEEQMLKIKQSEYLVHDEVK